MKNKSIIFSVLIVAVVAFTTLLFNSCEKENQATSDSFDQEYSKNIEVFDESGENSIILKVSSDDKSITDLYTAENFQLIINPEPFVAKVEEDLEEDLDEYSDEDAVIITMGVIEERFSVNVVEYEIVETQPDGFADIRAKFSKRCYYSSRDGVKVRRKSRTRRVYVWTKFCNSSCGTKDEDIKDKWEDGEYGDYKLSYDQEVSDKECGSTYMGAVVKCKKHDKGKYTWSFYNPTCP